MNVASINVYFREKYWYALPLIFLSIMWSERELKEVTAESFQAIANHDGFEQANVIKKAAPYQPTRSTPLNWSVILGTAVATIVCGRMRAVRHTFEYNLPSPIRSSIYQYCLQDVPRDEALQ